MTDAFRSAVIVVVAAVLGSSPLAQAQEQSTGPSTQPPPPKDPRELEAKKACLAGRSDQGIELLAALYAETNDPTYIYNQARCFEQNGKASEAVSRFREYLRKAPAVAPDEKAQIQAHIAELEQQARQAAATPALVVIPAATPATAPGALAQPNPTAEMAGNSPAETPDGKARARRIAAVAVAGVGVLALAGGITMGLLARGLENEVSRDADNGKFDRGKYDDGQRAVTWQWVGYGVGAAGLAAGGLLFYLSARPAAAGDGPRMMALPTLRPDGAGAAFRMTF